MSVNVLTKAYSAPPLSIKEILRYAGCGEASEEVNSLVDECVKEARGLLRYNVCYGVLSFETDGELCDFGALSVRSKNLAQALNGCKRAVVFAATIGVEIDRLIAKYSRLAPSKALMFHALGAERIESLCDAFCEDMAREYKAKMTTRFSSGYGDLPIESQKDIFGLLGCEKRIGLTLSDSMLMLPTKSVTAFVGIKD